MLSDDLYWTTEVQPSLEFVIVIIILQQIRNLITKNFPEQCCSEYTQSYSKPYGQGVKHPPTHNTPSSRQYYSTSQVYESLKNFPPQSILLDTTVTSHPPGSEFPLVPPDVTEYCYAKMVTILKTKLAIYIFTESRTAGEGKR